MKALILVAVVWAMAVAIPHHLQRRGVEPVKEPGRSPLERYAHHHTLSVIIFKKTIRYILEHVDFIGQTVENAQTAANHDSDVIKNQSAKMEESFNSVTHNLAYLALGLYHAALDFDENPTCNQYTTFRDIKYDHEEYAEKLGSMIESDTTCLLESIDSMIKAWKDEIDSKTGAISQREAMDVVFKMIEDLHLIRLNGKRVLESVPRWMWAAHNPEEQQGEDLDKRIVTLLREVLATKRGKPQGPGGGGKSAQGQKNGGGGNSAQGQKNGGGGKSAQGQKNGGGGSSAQGQKNGGGGKSAGSHQSDSQEQSGPYDRCRELLSSADDDSDSEGESEDASEEIPYPLTPEVFFAKIEEVGKAMRHVHDMFIEKLSDPSLHNEKEPFKAVQVWACLMNGAGHMIDHVIGTILVPVAYHLYIYDGTEITMEDKVCDDLDLSKQAAEEHAEYASCFTKHLEEAKNQAGILDGTCDGMTEHAAIKLVRDLFLEFHFMRLSVSRFYDALDHASSQSGGQAAIQRELIDLLKRRLAVQD